MKLSHLWVATAAVLLLVSAHGAKIDKFYDPLMGFAKWEESQPLDLETIQQMVSSAPKVTVYEGLPHHMFEGRSFRREAERADVFWVHGVPFYQKPLEPAAADLKLLTAIYVKPESHQRIAEEPKLCGGFHPDYYVVWNKGEKWIGAMICLGCAEWMSVNNEGYLYEDISKEAHLQLKKVLLKYISQRPKPDPAYEGEGQVLDRPPSLEKVKK